MHLFSRLMPNSGLFGVLILAFFTPFEVWSAEKITVDYDAVEQRFQVQQCYQSAPDYIESKSDQILQLTSDMKWQNNAIGFKRGYVELPDGESGCVSYAIDPLQNNNSRRLKEQHGDSLLLKIDHLFWQVADANSQTLPQVTINHSKKTKVSAPWKLVSRNPEQTIFQLKPTPKYADGYLALGPLAIDDVMIGQSKLRLAIMHGQHANKIDSIKKWVKSMADSVAEIGSSFPLKDVQVLVIMIDGQGGSVPWGQVNRGGGQGVLFVVNANKSEQQIFDDWTAAHEFSHLLIPYTPYDRWLSEGFASYYQNISRLRAGLLEEEAAWQKLVAGFARGQKSAAKSTAPTLKNSNRQHNMQMYWGGAVIALKADVALQQATQGAMDLSMALSGLKHCCLGTGKGWTAKGLFAELDKITSTNVFTNLYQQEVMRQSFPDYQSLLKQLGVKQSYNGGVSLNDDAPKAAIRKRISNG